MQPAEVQPPDNVPGVGWLINSAPSGRRVPVQPPGPAIGPESIPVALPDTAPGTMVPATVPVMVHLSHETEYGIENAPLLLTTVVPEASPVHALSGVAFKNTLKPSSKLQFSGVTVVTGAGVGAGG